MRPVKILGFRNNPKATLNRNLVLLIDNQPLVDLLEDSIPKNTGINQWQEKRDVRVVVSSLEQSIINPGEYDFLICAHCATPEDILMSSTQVIHQGEYLIWKMKPPGANFFLTTTSYLNSSFTNHNIKNPLIRLLAEVVIDN